MTWPAVGRTRPTSARTIVDFPAPDSPTIPTGAVPGVTSRSMPCTTSGPP
ncbi:Uncharacterised protein [Mycobacteroides abscessus]|nr:Uncharacterised protein [Mycobacteroides abscessus]